MRGISCAAMAYARKIGFDTAMQVGTFDGYPLYICMFLNREDEPCVGLPQYLIVDKNKNAIPLSLSETMLILKNKRKRKKKQKK